MSESTPSMFSFLDHLTYVEDDSSKYEVGVDENGFSYLDMLSDKKARKLSFQDKQARETSAALDGSTKAGGRFNVSKHEQVNHDEFCADTSLDQIIRDVRNRQQVTPLFPFAATAAGILTLAWLSLAYWLPNGWFLVLLTVWIPFFLLVGLWNVRKLDFSRRHIQFKYRFSAGGRHAFDRFNDTIATLTKSGQQLVLAGRKHFDDARYSGGASSLPDFAQVKWEWTHPPLLDLDFEVWKLRVHGRDLYFMPDHIMVFDGGNTGAVPYNRFSATFDSEVTQARGAVRVTRDAKVVGHTWRFVNKDGTPDQRFNANVQIPEVELGVSKMAVGNFDFALYLPNRSLAKKVPEGFSDIQRMAAVPHQKLAEQRHQAARPSKRLDESSPASATANLTADNVDPFETLLAALCLVMVADRRISPSEKAAIQEEMERANTPWPQEDVLFRIDRFVEEVQRNGLKTKLRETRRAMAVFKALGQEAMAHQAIVSLVKADGKVHDQERKIARALIAEIRPEKSESL